MTIDYEFLAERHNIEHGTRYKSGKAMIEDLYDRLNGAYGVADRLVINHKSVYHFMQRHGIPTIPRGKRERITPKKTAVLRALKKNPDLPCSQIAIDLGVSGSIVRHHRGRMMKNERNNPV